MMFKGKVILFSLLIVFATSVYAGDVDPCQCDFGVSCVEMRIAICPAGDYDFIREGCGGIDDFLWLIARDGDGNGIQYVPWTDYWLTACNDPGDLLLCSAPFAADFLTNDEGYTTISGRIAGGGCVLTGGVYLSIQGKTVTEPDCITPKCVDIQIISPDLIPTYWVDLSDFGVFGDSYNTIDGVHAEYNDCCDYVRDHEVNLSDFGYFGDHYNHICE